MNQPTPPPDMPTAGTQPKWQNDLSEVKRILQCSLTSVGTITTQFGTMEIGDHFLYWGNRWLISDITQVGLRVCINTSTGGSRGFRSEQMVEKIV